MTPQTENQKQSAGTTLVMKFGGSSLGSSAAIRQALMIVDKERPRWDNLVVVVSAMQGTTDALIQSAHAAVSGERASSIEFIDALKDGHKKIVDDLIADVKAREKTHKSLNELFDSLYALCNGIYIMGELTPRGMDAVVSHGERLMARLFSAALEKKAISSEPVDATRLIVTDDSFQNARPIMDNTQKQVRQVLPAFFKKRRIAVVTGFIAATEEGITTTLGRGGSDFTATLLANCLDAEEVWDWTDVDGVMTADPRMVPQARVIPELTYSEVSEMAYFGAKVLHPNTIRPVVEKQIPVWVKNTFNPDFPGTRICHDASSQPGQITAITAIRGLSLVNVEGRGMLGVPGIAARTFAAVAEQKASVLMISQSSSEQSICFVIPDEAVNRVVRAVEKQLAFELARKDIDQVWAQRDVVIVTAIGASIRQTPGVSARLFGVLGRERINVIAIAQGSSEYSISMVVDGADADRAVRKIHEEVIINGN